MKPLPYWPPASPEIWRTAIRCATLLLILFWGAPSLKDALVAWLGGAP